MQWYIYAGKVLHIDYATLDKLLLNEFFDLVVLYDKMEHPGDYQTVEELFL